MLRASVKEHYGPKAEKLTEFGVQPFRGRKLKLELPVVKAEEAPTNETE